jgi:hypothetical protein
LSRILSTTASFGLSGRRQALFRFYGFIEIVRGNSHISESAEADGAENESEINRLLLRKCMLIFAVTIGEVHPEATGDSHKCLKGTEIL